MTTSGDMPHERRTPAHRSPPAVATVNSVAVWPQGHRRGGFDPTKRRAAAPIRRR
jgi:hypothetical protein